MMSINPDSGGPPFFRPSTFWWKQPDGRRLFVYLNLSYPDGYDFFEPSHWRRGPVPAASDTRYRPPRAGDFFRTDTASLRAAHCAMPAANRGAPQGRLPLQRPDDFDDQPLADGQRPAVPSLAGVRCSLELPGPAAGAGVHDRVEGRRGNGAGRGRSRAGVPWRVHRLVGQRHRLRPARGRREPRAKRTLAAVQSPMWGPVDAATRAACDAMYKDLGLFDEHTWGSSLSVARPWRSTPRPSSTRRRPLRTAPWPGRNGCSPSALARGS